MSRKSSGKLSLLLEARLLNASGHTPVCAAMPLNTMFVHLNRSKFVSIIDATNAFFKIPVPPKKILILSFMFKTENMQKRGPLKAGKDHLPT